MYAIPTRLPTKSTLRNLFLHSILIGYRLHVNEYKQKSLPFYSNCIPFHLSFIHYSTLHTKYTKKTLCFLLPKPRPSNEQNTHFNGEKSIQIQNYLHWRIQKYTKIKGKIFPHTLHLRLPTKLRLAFLMFSKVWYECDVAVLSLIPSCQSLFPWPIAQLAAAGGCHQVRLPGI